MTSDDAYIMYGGCAVSKLHNNQCWIQNECKTQGGQNQDDSALLFTMNC